jgi:hypothetical protein
VVLFCNYFDAGGLRAVFQKSIVLSYEDSIVFQSRNQPRVFGKGPAEIERRVSENDNPKPVKYVV